MPALCRAVSLATLALLAGCAANRAPSPAQIAPAAPPDGGYGVIVAERSLSGAAPGIRMAILTRLGAAPVPVADTAAVEFIVRDQAGQTLSVVQDNARRLRPGGRVAIRRGPPTRLSPAATDVAGGPGG